MINLNTTFITVVLSLTLFVALGACGSEIDLALGSTSSNLEAANLEFGFVPTQAQLTTSGESLSNQSDSESESDINGFVAHPPDETSEEVEHSGEAEEHDSESTPSPSNTSTCNGSDIGINVGQRMKPFTLKRCDDTPFSIDQLCGTPVVEIQLHAGFCAACNQKVFDYMPNSDSDFADQGYQGLVVVTRGQAGFADAATCEGVETQLHDTNIIVVYDDSNLMAGDYSVQGFNEMYLLDDELTIHHYQPGSYSPFSVQNWIEAVLEM